MSGRDAGLTTCEVEQKMAATESHNEGSNTRTGDSGRCSLAVAQCCSARFLARVATET